MARAWQLCRPVRLRVPSLAGPPIPRPVPSPLRGGLGEGVPARLAKESDAHTPTSNSSPQGRGEHAHVATVSSGPAPSPPLRVVRSRASPLRGGLGWGCRRPSSTRLALTPPPPTPPRKGEESSARRFRPPSLALPLPAASRRRPSRRRSSGPSGPSRTGTVSPSWISPDRISSASGSCTCFWITRFRGRAP